MSAVTTPAEDLPVFEALAEDALLLRFGDRIEVQLNARVHAAAQQLRQALPQVECVPAYASLLLRFDPAAWDAPGQGPHRRLEQRVRQVLDCAAAPAVASRLVEIPVCYGGEFGPDLAEVAARTGLTPEQVVARHSAAEYRVAMLGFAPGFAYLLGLDPALSMPRRADPRLRVPAGSVAIGGSQTGVYPADLPGGWNLIGRTPQRLFDPRSAEPSLLQSGDRVRFHAVDAAAYHARREQFAP